MFADDTNLFIAGRSIEELEQIINEELQNISKWFQANLLSLNIKKTSYIIFRNNNTKKLNITIKIQNIAIERQNETKFLGVILSSNLKWTLHIDVVLAKISKTIGIIAKVRHIIPQTLTKMLYLTLVEPYINYCNIVWGSSARTTDLEKIFKVQKKYCRLITFSGYKDHSKRLFKDLNLMNVFDIYKCQLSCYMFKLVNFQLPDIYRFSYNDEIHSHDTRHKSDIHKAYSRTKSRQSTVRFQGPFLWNNLPIKIKNSPSANVFKKRVKYYFTHDCNDN